MIDQPVIMASGNHENWSFSIMELADTELSDNCEYLHILLIGQLNLIKVSVN